MGAGFDFVLQHDSHVIIEAVDHPEGGWPQRPRGRRAIAARMLDRGSTRHS